MASERLIKLKTYIENNASKIINYRERQKQGLPFTSNLAESTVESLINQRCKGQQHMRWSREGLDPILQLQKLHFLAPQVNRAGAFKNMRIALLTLWANDEKT